jgi:hypothetical protein
LAICSISGRLKRAAGLSIQHLLSLVIREQVGKQFAELQLICNHTKGSDQCIVFTTKAGQDE